MDIEYSSKSIKLVSGIQNIIRDLTTLEKIIHASS